ncbi:MAG: Na+/H+ antiporter NhaC family protein [Clostridiales bacterium]|nr:Na+/H+ antiporter NhaC family protein [Candidatus Crickella caballi]
MHNSRRNLIFTLGLAAMLIAAVPMLVLAEEEAPAPALYATGWAVLPPLVAIALALITKEVYSSLFVGIITGAVLYAGASFSGILEHALLDGVVASLSDSWNVGILVFLVVLGMMVALMNKSGGSRAFGNWASSRVKSRVAAQLTSVVLGVLIFVDDYFNCLTVGSVMKPVTDRFNVSRAKLAYIIDATAAPVCIIAPISSWAAAVTGFVEGQNGFTIFIKAIPYNFYALFTLFFMVSLVTMKFDFATMAKYERNAVENGDLFTDKAAQAEAQVEAEAEGKENGSVWDLVFPVLVLIISCVIGMVYSGGFFSGEKFVTAFANSDASVGLALGSVVAVIVAVIYYIARRILTFSECMDCIPEGFRQMVSPILVLTFAWSLKNMTDSLGLADFVSGLVENMPNAFMGLIPAVLFAVACVLAFASGTSWGTFGILIPIGLAITDAQPELMIPVISACMAGAVYGDHVSPISDTTIMAPAGASCNHVSHVSTQLPYATTVAVIAFICYIIAGYTLNPIVPLIVGFAMVFGVLMFFKSRSGSYVVSDEANHKN